MDSRQRLRYTLLGLFVAIVAILLLLVALPSLLPAHHYTASEMSADEGPTLSNRTLTEGTERNADVAAFADLSERERAAFRDAREANGSNSPARNDSLFEDVTHVVENGTLFRLHATETDEQSALAVSVVSDRDALPIVAVPTTDFTESSAFYAPDSKRHVVESAIEDGSSTSATIVRVNRTLVSYRDAYYLLNSSGAQNG